jgi:hypothetical protein
MGTLQGVGVQPERMLRAPGSADDTIGCTTFILFLRCVLEAFLLQHGRHAQNIKYFPVNGDVKLGEWTITTKTKGKHKLSPGDMVCDGTNKGTRVGEKKGQTLVTVGYHGLEGNTQHENWKAWLKSNEDVTYSEVSEIIKKDAAARAALGAFVAAAVAPEHGAAKALILEHGTMDGVLVLSLLHALHESEEKAMGEQRGTSAHKRFHTLALGQFTSFAGFLTAIDRAAEDYNRANSDGINDAMKFHQLVYGIEAKSSTFATQLTVDQAKHDKGDNPYAWARAWLCRMPASAFPATEHANVLGDAASKGVVTEAQASAFAAMTQVLPNGITVGAHDSRFGRPGQPLSRGGLGTELVIVSEERETPPLSESAPLSQAASPPPQATSSPVAERIGQQPYIDPDTGRIVCGMIQRKPVVVVKAKAIVTPRVIVRRKPSVGVAVGRALREFAPPQFARQILMLLLAGALGWIAHSAYGHMQDNDNSLYLQKYQQQQQQQFAQQAMGAGKDRATAGHKPGVLAAGTDWAVKWELVAQPGEPHMPISDASISNSSNPWKPAISRANHRDAVKSLRIGKKRATAAAAFKAAAAAAAVVGFGRSDPRNLISGPSASLPTSWDSPAASTGARGLEGSPPHASRVRLHGDSLRPSRVTSVSGDPAFPASSVGVAPPIHSGTVPTCDDVISAVDGTTARWSSVSAAGLRLGADVAAVLPACRGSGNATVALEQMLCDSGATCHLSKSLLHAFNVRAVPPGLRAVFAAGGERHPILNTFSMHFENPTTGIVGTLHNVSHAPGLRYEILSVRCLVNSKCDVEFHSKDRGGCFVQTPSGHRLAIEMSESLPHVLWRRIAPADFAKLPPERRAPPPHPRATAPERRDIALPAIGSPNPEDGITPFTCDTTHQTILRRCHCAMGHCNMSTFRDRLGKGRIRASETVIAAASAKACSSFFCSHCAQHKAKPRAAHSGVPQRQPNAGQQTVDEGVAKIVESVTQKGQCWFLDASKISVPARGERACRYSHVIWCVDPFDNEIMCFPVETLKHTDRAIVHFVDTCARRGDPLFIDRRNISTKIVADSAFAVDKVQRVMRDFGMPKPKIAPAGRHECLGAVEGCIDQMQVSTAAMMSSGRVPHFLMHHAFEAAKECKNRFGGSKTRNHVSAHEAATTEVADTRYILPFGTICRVYVQPNDRRDGMARGIFCAYLRPAYDGPSGTALVFCFETGRVHRTRDFDGYTAPANVPSMNVNECCDLLNLPGKQRRDDQRDKIRERLARPETVAVVEGCSCATCKVALNDTPDDQAQVASEVAAAIAADATPCKETETAPSNIFQMRRSSDWARPGGWRSCLMTESGKLLSDNDGYGPSVVPVSPAYVAQVMESHPGTELLGTVATCRYKVLDSAGEYERRCRICLNGAQEQGGTIAQGTHSPVAYPFSHHTLMCKALASGWCTSQFDIKTAFPTAPMPEGVRVFCIPPKECATRTADGKLAYWECKRNLYGGRTAPKIFFRDLVQRTLLKFPGTATQCDTDPCVFKFKAVLESGPVECWLSLHVDDGCLVSSSQMAEDWFYTCLTDGEGGRHKYNINKGPLERFLGANIEDTVDEDSGRRCISKSMHQAITQLAHDFEMTACEPCYNPMPCHKKSKLSDYTATTADQADQVRDANYAGMVGSLNWIASCGRPDLCIAAKTLARFSANPSPFAVAQARRCLAYAYTTRHRCLKWWAPEQGTTELKLVAFTDADHAGLTHLEPESDAMADRSIAASYFAYAGMGAAVEWRAVAIKWPTINSTESEAAALADAHTNVMFMRDHLEALGARQDKPTMVHSDSDPAVRNMFRFTSPVASRHLNNLLHRARYMVQEKKVDYTWVKGQHNACDFLTKRLPHRQFNSHAATVLGSIPPLRDG